MLNYPHVDTPKDPDAVVIRASAHSDYGILTILKQDDGCGGLQVTSPVTGRWVDILRPFCVLSLLTSRITRGNIYIGDKNGAEEFVCDLVREELMLWGGAIIGTSGDRKIG